MTSIKGYADLLAKGAVGPINDAQSNFLNTIRSNVSRMATLGIRSVRYIQDRGRAYAPGIQLSIDQ